MGPIGTIKPWDKKVWGEISRTFFVRWLFATLAKLKYRKKCVLILCSPELTISHRELEAAAGVVHTNNRSRYRRYTRDLYIVGPSY